MRRHNVVQSPRVYLIFVGAYWTSSPGDTYLTSIAEYVRDVINSTAFYEPLYQYSYNCSKHGTGCKSIGYNIKPGALKGVYTYNNAASSVSDSTIQQWMNTYVGSSLPAADNDTVRGVAPYTLPVRPLHI
jgi:hypothetical protein